MNFRRIDLEEYLERLPEDVKKLKLPKTYLQQRLENETAEYYLINEEYGFFIYKEENNVVDLNVYEKDPTSIFDNKEIMNSIFEFLKNKGYKTITMNLDKNQYKERQALAIDYGFKEIETLKQGDFEYINYEKDL